MGSSQVQPSPKRDSHSHARSVQHLRAALFASTALTVLVSTPMARADGLEGITVPGSTNAQLNGISGDGTVFVGEARVAGVIAPMMMSNGVATFLPRLVAGLQTSAHAANFDGSVIVGTSRTVSGSIMP